ncbi:MAG: twin-arginine translocation signal domain-containing protein, partial [Pseudomonadota bacterium]
MTNRIRERGIHELYAEDPERADDLVWGRRTSALTRRGFLRGSGLTAMGAVLGGALPFAEHMPGGLIPAAFAQSADDFVIEGKDGLLVLNDRPINAETPAHLLDDAVTPASRLFVRNNGIPPQVAEADPANWTLQIDGEACLNPRTFSLLELQRDFTQRTMQ